MKLNALPLTHEIIFWWDQAPDAEPPAEYTLRQGEKILSAGPRTHGRAEGLRPGETVSVSLCASSRLHTRKAVTALLSSLHS